MYFYLKRKDTALLFFNSIIDSGGPMQKLKHWRMRFMFWPEGVGKAELEEVFMLKGRSFFGSHSDQ
jgi:hypothetical protein